MGTRCDCCAVVFCRLPLRALVFFLVSLAGFVPLLASCVSWWTLLRIRGFCVFEFVGIQHSISLCDISCLFFQYL